MSFMGAIEFYYTEAFMPETCTVVIGDAKHLEALREHAGSDGEVLTFSDTDALAALEAITSRRPAVVTLERLFAATSRGAALINRIKADASLASAEIRVVSHDGAYSRVSPRRTPPPAPDPVVSEEKSEAGGPAPPLDYRGTRRAPRFRMTDGTEAQVDGVTATLVDLSICGAQLVCTSPLKPQQRVRITLADDRGVVRISASVAWAFFEIPKGVTRYRAGVEFQEAETKAVDAFCRRHRKS
jgi:hypothetical protein